MPPARRGPAPLTDDDVARVREELAAGAEPRVQLLVDTPAAPAGTRAPVVALRDPGAEPEFIVLRVAGDELPFSPAELTWPVRARAVRGGAAASGAAAPGGTSAPEPPVEATGARGASAEAGGVWSAPEGADSQVTVSGDAAPGQSGRPAAEQPATAGERAADQPATASGLASPAAGGTGTAESGTAAATRPRRPRTSGTSPVGAQPFTVTLRFTGAGWTAETTRGGRRGKARPVPVAAVRGLAERLDDPELRRAVLAAVEACREQALARAERLRAELEQVETVLAQLDDDA